MKALTILIIMAGLLLAGTDSARAEVAMREQATGTETPGESVYRIFDEKAVIYAAPAAPRLPPERLVFSKTTVTMKRKASPPTRPREPVRFELRQWQAVGIAL